MQRIVKADALKYELDHRDEPLLRVAQGESFVVETYDAQSGAITSADVAPLIAQMPNAKAEPGKGNPVGGPVFVEGAEPGDLLEVHHREDHRRRGRGGTHPGPKGGPPRRLL